jgi:SRSO17 transposase
MAGIVEFPRIVESALAAYGDIFANEAQRRHFGEYLTGLLVAARKTVLGISGEFAETTDQSNLNRFMTQYEWDTEKLNDRRLEKHQEDPTTRYSCTGSA